MPSYQSMDPFELRRALACFLFQIDWDELREDHRFLKADDLLRRHLRTGCSRCRIFERALA